MHTQYGPGDSATWGQIHSTADPRYQEDDDTIEAIAAEEMARLCDGAGEDARASSRLPPTNCST